MKKIVLKSVALITATTLLIGCADKGSKSESVDSINKKIESNAVFNSIMKGLGDEYKFKMSLDYCEKLTEKEDVCTSKLFNQEYHDVVLRGNVIKSNDTNEIKIYNGMLNIITKENHEFTIFYKEGSEYLRIYNEIPNEKKSSITTASEKGKYIFTLEYPRKSIKAIFNTDTNNIEKILSLKELNPNTNQIEEKIK